MGQVEDPNSAAAHPQGGAPARSPVAPTLVRIEPADAAGSAPEELLGVPYRVASVRGYVGDLHEAGTSRLAADVEAIVRVEGPVHIDEVSRRIMDASGVAKLGSRIRAAMEAAARYAAKNGVVRAGDFLSIKGATDVPVRDRSSLRAASRKIEYVAPAEVREAILRVVEASFGIASEDIPLEVARLFGFAQTSAQIRAYIENVLLAIQKKGELAERGGVVVRT